MSCSPQILFVTSALQIDLFSAVYLCTLVDFFWWFRFSGKCNVMQHFHKIIIIIFTMITYHHMVLNILLNYSPYWISSYDESFSSFRNMGVWEYCFNNFRYPYNQYDKVFNGCQGIFSSDYNVIREWLLPGNFNNYTYINMYVCFCNRIPRYLDLELCVYFCFRMDFSIGSFY